MINLSPNYQAQTQSLRHTLATSLRRARNRRGLSQEELAHRSGMHRTYIGAVERAERNISADNIERIAVALGVSVVELLRSAHPTTGNHRIPKS